MTCNCLQGASNVEKYKIQFQKEHSGYKDLEELQKKITRRVQASIKTLLDKLFPPDNQTAAAVSLPSYGVNDC